MLDVLRHKGSVKLFRGGSNREIGDADAGMTATPTATELSGAARHGFVDWNPSDRGEEPVGHSTLGRTQPLHYLDPTDLRTDWAIFEPGEIFKRLL